MSSAIGTLRGIATLAAVTTLLAAAVTAPAGAEPAGESAPEIPTEGLAASYDFSATTGQTLTDRSGHGADAVISGTPAWSDGSMTFTGENYVELPDTLLADTDTATVVIETAPRSLSGAQFLWNFGGSGDDATGQFFIQPVDPRVSISATNYKAEDSARADQKLTEGSWQSIAATIAENPDRQTSTLRLYVDGQLWAENDSSKTNLADLTTHTMNYIGHSAYRPDSLFRGKVSAFHVYDTALTADDLTAIAEVDAQSAATETAQSLDLQAANEQALSEIAFDLTLPDQPDVSWSFEPEGIIGDGGTVTQPAEDTPVTATATVDVRGKEATTQFQLTVLRAPTDSDKAERDLAAITIPEAADLRGAVSLPERGSLYQSDITWQSSDPSVIDAEGSDVVAPGAVTRPKRSDAEITLTATATNNGTSKTREFPVTVRAAYTMPETTDYLFAHFTGGEGRASDEQIYFATSHDGKNFTDTRPNGDPVLALAADEGDGGVRDPFLIRSPEGDRFFLIATDLSIYHRGGWGTANATSTGSTKMVVWESTDLVNWSKPRFPDVAGPIPDAGMLWAPEAFWDEETQQYYVYWATRSDSNTELGDPVDVYLATTRDFRTFSDPIKWIDREGSIIDTTMIKVGDWYYRASGDGQITIEKSKKIATPTVSASAKKSGNENEWVLVGTLQSILEGSGDCNGGHNYTGGCLEGPELFQFNDDDTADDTALYGLIADQYAAGRGYLPFTTTDIGSASSAQWSPATDVDFGELKKRHGGILPITAAEYQRIMYHYAGVGTDPDAGPDLTVSTRCLAGSAYVIGTVANAGEEATDITITSEYGSRTISSLAPGRSSSFAFNSRRVQIDAGEVQAKTDASQTGADYSHDGC